MKYWFVQGDVVSHTLKNITFNQNVYSANTFAELLKYLNYDIPVKKNEFFKINFLIEITETDFNMIKGN